MGVIIKIQIDAFPKVFLQYFFRVHVLISLRQQLQLIQDSGSRELLFIFQLIIIEIKLIRGRHENEIDVLCLQFALNKLQCPVQLVLFFVIVVPFHIGDIFKIKKKLRGMGGEQFLIDGFFNINLSIGQIALVKEIPGQVIKRKLDGDPGKEIIFEWI